MQYLNLMGIENECYVLIEFKLQLFECEWNGKNDLNNTVKDVCMNLKENGTLPLSIKPPRVHVWKENAHH